MGSDLDEKFTEIVQLMEDNQIEFVDFKVVDLFGHWRHLTIPAKKFTKEFIRRGIGFDASSYGYELVENSDLLFVPDVQTAKLEPTENREVVSIVSNIYRLSQDNQLEPYPQDPRRTVSRAIQYLRTTEIAEDFLVSPEFEFYLFDEADYHYGHTKGGFSVRSSETPEEGLVEGDVERNQGHYLLGSLGYHAPRPADSVMELRNRIVSYLEREGIDVKYHHHETGAAGESEIEVGFSSLLDSADNTMYIKQIVKVIADLEGMSATFMPKPLGGLPGNGLHLHHYLVKDGENMFFGDRYAGLSKLALFFLGGLLEHGRSLMALTNPSTNSYRRMVPGHEAPTDLVFAKSNRSAAIRIPGYVRSDSNTRLELRTVDATCNPYLAYSAILMAGIDGIRNQIDPEKLGYGPLEKNVYELSEKEKQGIKSTPGSLEGAIKALENDHQYLLEGDVYTEKQLTNWISLKKHEISKFHDKPHPYEHMLYFDV